MEQTPSRRFAPVRALLILVVMSKQNFGAVLFFICVLIGEEREPLLTGEKSA